MRAQPHRLIFLDETGTNTRMTREYGRSLRGERLKGSAPFRRRGNQTLIAGLSYDGIVAPWVISGAMDRDAFDTYIEKVLIPELEPGSVVILDNLATHKSDHAAQMLKAHGCWFLFLPAYSPDLNPIEMALSKLKARRALPERSSNSIEAGEIRPLLRQMLELARRPHGLPHEFTPQIETWCDWHRNPRRRALIVGFVIPRPTPAEHTASLGSRIPMAPQ